MNRTLVELARTMLTAHRLPEFLWEYAVLHAAYIRNRSYTRSLSKTPYENWFIKKPNVSCLREFGAPVWVLLQGQNQQRKMLPKSKQRYYIGSRNFCFINDTDQKVTPSEAIVIDPSPALPHEGELGADTPQADKLSGSKRKREMSALDDETVEPARKLRENLHVNYRYLNDPFEEDEQHEQAQTSTEITYAAYTESALRGTEPKTPVKRNGDLEACRKTQ